MFISGPKIQELQNELDENLGLRIVSDWLYEKKKCLWMLKKCNYNYMVGIYQNISI